MASRHRTIRFLVIAGGVIDIRFQGRPGASRQQILQWIGRAGEAVSHYYGRFPVKHVTILVRSGPGRVRNGNTGIGLVNMGSTPVRAAASEQAASSGASAADAAAVADDGTDPPADLNASPEYRRHLSHVLVRRALEEAGG